MCPRIPWLLDATVAENIAFGAPRATRDDMLEAGSALKTRPAGRSFSQASATSSVVNEEPCFSARAVVEASRTTTTDRMVLLVTP
jgi:hypothetical protein